MVKWQLLHEDTLQTVFVIAVKRLKRPEGATEEEISAFFQAERDTLLKMREIAHPNLIRAIATYEKGRQGEERCFVFPWASGGNLRQLWMNRLPNPQRTIFPWAWEQIRGLTEGLSILHDKGTRHGDLKPENILQFNRGNDPEPASGSLVIADVGIAKYHAYETSERKAREIKTNARFFTGQYEPPEIRLDEPRTISRKYDSWSLGCVLLEFIIWLQRGKKGLEDFRADRLGETFNEDRFWKGPGEKEDRSLLPAASKWIESLLQELKDQQLWAWFKLLELVKTCLLVAVLKQRESIRVFWSELQKLHEECSADSSPARDRSDTVLTKRRDSRVRMIDDVDMHISQHVSSTDGSNLIRLCQLTILQYVSAYQ